MVKNKKKPDKQKLNKEKVKKIIFIDFDGTLVDSFDAHIKSFNGAFLKNNMPPVYPEKILKIFGMPSEVIIMKLFPRISKRKLKKINEDKKNLFIKKYYKLVKVFPKVNPTLAKLRKKAMIVLETNASLQEVKKVAKCCGLNLEYFDLILSKEKVKHRKPSPELIKKAETMLGKRKVEYVVGDSIVDILLAKKGRVKSIIIINRINKKNLKIIKKYKPDIIIKNFAQLLRVIDKKRSN